MKAAIQKTIVLHASVN